MTQTAGLYYPSCVVNLRLRFDTAFRVDETQGAFAGTPTYTGATQTGLPTSSDTAGAAGKQAPKLGTPLVLAAGQTDVARAIAIVPKSCTVEMAGFRTAGRWTLTMPFRNLPIDPRLLKAAGVTILMDTVLAEDFADGIARTRSDGGRNSQVRFDDKSARVSMAGVVDTWSLKHTASGSEVAMEGRDLSAVLMDSPARPQWFEDLDLKQTIDNVVRQIIAKHPVLSGLDSTIGALLVPVVDPGFPNGVIPSPYQSGNVTAVLSGADGNKRNRRAGKGEANSLSFWDLIVQYCALCGCVPYFRGQQFRLRPQRTLYTRLQAGQPGNPTPFAGGTARILEGEKPIAVRRLYYGRDIQEITYDRKYTGKKASVVEVVCLNTSSAERGEKKLLRVWWPQDMVYTKATKTLKSLSGKANRATLTNVSPSGQGAAKDVLRVAVSGFTNEKDLIPIAQGIYEEVMRGEMGGTFKTTALASYGGDNADADMLSLRPGEPVQMVVDKQPLVASYPVVAELVSHARRSFAEEVAAVAKDCGDEQLARAIVATARGAIIDLQQFFYITNVKFDWQANSGITVSSDFANYIEPVQHFDDGYGL